MQIEVRRALYALEKDLPPVDVIFLYQVIEWLGDVPERWEVAFIKHIADVRFSGVDNVISLRRQECLLHSDGEIAMGAPFTDFSSPTISFKLVDGSMVLGHGPLVS